jgi:hypothetical protein
MANRSESDNREVQEVRVSCSVGHDQHHLERIITHLFTHSPCVFVVVACWLASCVLLCTCFVACLVAMGDSQKLWQPNELFPASIQYTQRADGDESGAPASLSRSGSGSGFDTEDLSREVGVRNRQLLLVLLDRSNDEVRVLSRMLPFLKQPGMKMTRREHTSCRVVDAFGVVMMMQWLSPESVHAKRTRRGDYLSSTTFST